MTIKNLENKLEDKYGVRYCKCGEKLIPRKVFLKDIILYKCPKSNIFNKNDHSISKAFFMKTKTNVMKMVGNDLRN